MSVMKSIARHAFRTEHLLRARVLMTRVGRSFWEKRMINAQPRNARPPCDRTCRSAGSGQLRPTTCVVTLCVASSI